MKVCPTCSEIYKDDDINFCLADGTTLGRPYFVETRELMGGVILPEEFGRILERYLGE